MKIIGVTGTNGKTTVTWILQKVLEKAGYATGLIGTITGRLTTPSPWELNELFAKFKAEKKDFVVMELSSHGIHQDRARGIYFLVKVLTNITRDHLDYHKTFRAYKNTKLNWLKQGEGIKIYPKDYLRKKIDFAHRFLGEFNHRNLQAVLAVTDALQLDRSIVKQALAEIPPVPGRFETIEAGQPFSVVVDYAHTPDGLKNILEAAKAVLKKQKQGRLLTLFGCGGDRDKGKRPTMGKLACKYSDLTLVTSDNPRTEDPKQIIQDILAGTKTCGKKPGKEELLVEIDRGQAITQLLGLAQANDFVLLAGKGHEDYQVIGTEKIHFDDREEARKNLKKLGYQLEPTGK